MRHVNAPHSVTRATERTYADADPGSLHLLEVGCKQHGDVHTGPCGQLESCSKEVGGGVVTGMWGRSDEHTHRRTL